MLALKRQQTSTMVKKQKDTDVLRLWSNSKTIQMFYDYGQTTKRQRCFMITTRFNVNLEQLFCIRLCDLEDKS